MARSISAFFAPLRDNSPEANREIRRLSSKMYDQVVGSMPDRGDDAVADIQKVSVALTSDQVAALKAAVETGEYATTSEIAREAIRDWQFKHKLRQEDIKRLRQLRDEGKASGPAEPLDVKRTLAAARARLKELEAGAE